jgi:hypothetical protein
MIFFDLIFLPDGFLDFTFLEQAELLISPGNFLFFLCLIFILIIHFFFFIFVKEKSTKTYKVKIENWSNNFP